MERGSRRGSRRATSSSSAASSAPARRRWFAAPAERLASASRSSRRRSRSDAPTADARPISHIDLYRLDDLAAEEPTCSTTTCGPIRSRSSSGPTRPARSSSATASGRFASVAAPCGRRPARDRARAGRLIRARRTGVFDCLIDLFLNFLGLVLRLFDCFVGAFLRAVDGVLDVLAVACAIGGVQRFVGGLVGRIERFVGELFGFALEASSASFWTSSTASLPCLPRRPRSPTRLRRQPRSRARLASSARGLRSVPHLDSPSMVRMRRLIAAGGIYSAAHGHVNPFKRPPRYRYGNGRHDRRSHARRRAAQRANCPRRARRAPAPRFRPAERDRGGRRAGRRLAAIQCDRRRRRTGTFTGLRVGIATARALAQGRACGSYRSAPSPRSRSVSGSRRPLADGRLAADRCAQGRGLRGAARADDGAPVGIPSRPRRNRSPRSRTSIGLR